MHRITLYLTGICCTIFLIPIHADNNLRLQNMQSMGTGSSGIVQSVVWNPAILSVENSRILYFQYYNRYGIKELSSFNGSITYPNPLLNVGLDIHSFGYDDYRESLFRLLVSKRLDKYWAAGLSVQYAIIQTKLYDERPAWISTDIGISYQPVDNLLIGLLMMNLPSVVISEQTAKYKHLINYAIQIGLKWEIINNLLILSGISYEGKHSFSGSIGLEYSITDSFFLRGGLQIHPVLPSFGIGYLFSPFQVDVAAVSHAVLGWSTGIGITFYY